MKKEILQGKKAKEKKPKIEKMWTNHGVKFVDENGKEYSNQEYLDQLNNAMVYTKVK